MQQYQQTLSGRSSTTQGITDLVKHFSKFVRIFCSHIPLTSMADNRFEEIMSVFGHFGHWNSHCKTQKELSQTANKYQQNHIKITIPARKPSPVYVSSVFQIISASINFDEIVNICWTQWSRFSGTNTTPNANQYRNPILHISQRLSVHRSMAIWRHICTKYVHFGRIHW